MKNRHKHYLYNDIYDISVNQRCCPIENIKYNHLSNKGVKETKANFLPPEEFQEVKIWRSKNTTHITIILNHD